MMTSGTNRAGGHAVPRVVLGAAQCQGQGTRRIVLVAPWLACSLTGTLRVMHPPPPHSHSPPSNTLSRPHAQRRVEGMGANIFIGETRINASFMITLKLQNLVGKAIGKARRLPFNTGWRSPMTR